MSFRDREKQRLIEVKNGSNLFSADARQAGRYEKNGQTYDFCLHETCNQENLYAGIRSEALRYFQQAGITWHDGVNGGPSNHLCCSQSACANSLFPLSHQPDTLKQVLAALRYPVDEVLPITDDVTLSNGRHPYVGFEWIGRDNYLNERVNGIRIRGQNATSADFVIRFRRTDGLTHLILGEWKYTEHYSGSKLTSGSGTNRQATYQPELNSPDCPVQLPKGEHALLFNEPFYQMMRLQLLAQAMERKPGREMEADIVSVLHISPRANRDLQQRITAKGLKRYGTTIYEVWYALVGNTRFLACPAEELWDLLCDYSADTGWSDYLKMRYARMK